MFKGVKSTLKKALQPQASAVKGKRPLTGWKTERKADHPQKSETKLQKIQADMEKLDSRLSRIEILLTKQQATLVFSQVVESCCAALVLLLKNQFPERLSSEMDLSKILKILKEDTATASKVAELEQKLQISFDAVSALAQGGPFLQAVPRTTFEQAVAVITSNSVSNGNSDLIDLFIAKNHVFKSSPILPPSYHPTAQKLAHLYNEAAEKK